MHKSVIVVDDFLEQPDLLRRSATQQEYPKLKKAAFFPGRNSKHPQIINGYDQRISEIVGQKLVRQTESAPYAKFRLALEGDTGTKGVHIDNVEWTAILYLTLPEYCQDGTHLFRHIPTNTDRAPLTLEECHSMGCNGFPDFWDTVLNPHTNDPSKWEKTLSIPMRYNRLVIIQAQQYHDAGLSFGTSIEDGRLIYLTGYNSA